MMVTSLHKQYNNHAKLSRFYIQGLAININKTITMPNYQGCNIQGLVISINNTMTMQIYQGFNIQGLQ